MNNFVLIIITKSLIKMYHVLLYFNEILGRDVYIVSDLVNWCIQKVSPMVLSVCSFLEKFPCKILISWCNL